MTLYGWLFVYPFITLYYQKKLSTETDPFRNHLYDTTQIIDVSLRRRKANVVVNLRGT